MPFDPKLYLVTDRTLAGSRDIFHIVDEAVRGGVSMVQLREKNLTSRDFLEIATELRRRLREKKIPLLINDRVDIALAVGADGVHLGQDDLPVAKAREIMGPRAIIGLSIENRDQAEKARSLDLDYLAVSAVFPTATKTLATPPWGLSGLREVRRLVGERILIAIGGISPENAPSVLEAGADGVAVVSAIFGAEDPGAAAASLRNAVEPSRGYPV